MRQRNLFAGLSLIIFVFAGFRSVSGQDLVSSDELKKINYYKYWQLQVPMSKKESLLQIERVEDTIYAITSKTILYSIDAQTGVIRWSAKLGGNGYRVYCPVHVQSFWGKNLTLVATTGKMIWLDRKTGERVYEYEPAFPISTSAVSDGLRVYVGGMDDMLHCLKFVPTRGFATLVNLYNVSPGCSMGVSPVLWGSSLFFASDDGRIRVCQADSKVREWVFRSESPQRAGLLVDSTGVYVATADRFIYRLNVDTGQVVWRYRTEGKMSHQPVILGEHLFQVVEGNGVVVLDTDTGELAWSRSGIVDFVASDSENVYLLDDTGCVLAADPVTGEIRSRVEVGFQPLLASNPGGGAWYWGNSAGLVFCAQSDRVPYLRVEQVQAAMNKEQSSGSESASTSPDSTPTESNNGLRDLLKSQSTVPPMSD